MIIRPSQESKKAPEQKIDSAQTHYASVPFLSAPYRLKNLIHIFGFYDPRCRPYSSVAFISDALLGRVVVSTHYSNDAQHPNTAQPNNDDNKIQFINIETQECYPPITCPDEPRVVHTLPSKEVAVVFTNRVEFYTTNDIKNETRIPSIVNLSADSPIDHKAKIINKVRTSSDGRYLLIHINIFEYRNGSPTERDQHIYIVSLEPNASERHARKISFRESLGCQTFFDMDISKTGQLIYSNAEEEGLWSYNLETRKKTCLIEDGLIHMIYTYGDRMILAISHSTAYLTLQRWKVLLDGTVKYREALGRVAWPDHSLYSYDAIYIPKMIGASLVFFDVTKKSMMEYHPDFAVTGPSVRPIKTPHVDFDFSYRTSNMHLGLFKFKQRVGNVPNDRIELVPPEERQLVFVRLPSHQHEVLQQEFVNLIRTNTAISERIPMPLWLLIAGYAFIENDHLPELRKGVTLRS